MSAVPHGLLAQDVLWNTPAVVSSDDSYASQMGDSPVSPLSSAEIPPKKRRKVVAHDPYGRRTRVRGMDVDAVLKIVQNFRDADGFHWFQRSHGLPNLGYDHHNAHEHSKPPTHAPHSTLPDHSTSHSSSNPTTIVPITDDANDTQHGSNTHSISSNPDITEKTGLRDIRSKLSLVRNKTGSKNTNDVSKQKQQEIGLSVVSMTGKEEASDSDLSAAAAVAASQTSHQIHRTITDIHSHHSKTTLTDIDESPPPPSLLTKQVQKSQQTSNSNSNSDPVAVTTAAAAVSVDDDGVAVAAAAKGADGKSEAAPTHRYRKKKKKKGNRKKEVRYRDVVEKVLVKEPKRILKKKRRKKKKKKKTTQNRRIESNDATLPTINQDQIEATSRSDSTTIKVDGKSEEMKSSDISRTKIPDYPRFKMSSKSHCFSGENASETLQRFETSLVKESNQLVVETYQNQSQFSWLIDAVRCANQIYSSKIPALSNQLANDVISTPVTIDVEKGLLRSTLALTTESSDSTAALQKKKKQSMVDALSLELESIGLEIASAERQLALVSEIDERLSGMHDFQCQLQQMIEPELFVNERMNEIEACHTAVYLSVDDSNSNKDDSESGVLEMLSSKRIQFEDNLADKLEEMVDHLDHQNSLLLFKWHENCKSQTKLNNQLKQLEQIMDEQTQRIAGSNRTSHSSDDSESEDEWCLLGLVDSQFKYDEYKRQKQDQIKRFDRSKYI